MPFLFNCGYQLLADIIIVCLLILTTDAHRWTQILRIHQCLFFLSVVNVAHSFLPTTHKDIAWSISAFILAVVSILQLKYSHQPFLNC